MKHGLIILLGVMGLVGCAGLKTEPESPRTFCRFVPERADDFAWENDVVAFRAYGPGSETLNGDSGFDCWLKRVNYPILNKWYAQHQQGLSYHTDHGEGHDPYHVGASRGCGGSGLWIDGALVTSGVFTDWEIIESTPEQSTFVLSYEWSHDGVAYREEKQISIRLGDQLFRVLSTFWKEGELATDLSVVIGLTLHEGKASLRKDEAQGWLACWETIGDAGVGTGVVIEPSRMLEVKQILSERNDESHALILSKTDAAGQLEYYAGYAWEKAGDITSFDAWTDYLKAFPSE